jgi:hypothetical protein
LRVARSRIELPSAAADMNPALEILGKDVGFNPVSSFSGFQFLFSFKGCFLGIKELYMDTVPRSIS